MLDPTPRYGGCLGFKLTDNVDAYRLIFEQFTGLKDEHGNDIYEGDICLNRSDNTWGQVVFEEGAFWYVEDNEQTLLWKVTNTIEVYGNIHEHSELFRKPSNEQ